MLNLSYPEWISLGSFGISCASLLIAFKGLHNSSRALDFSRKEHIEKSKSVEAYLIRSSKMHFEDKGVFACFALSYTNRATVPNTISEIVLIVHYEDSNGIIQKSQLASERGKELSFSKNGIESFPIPLNMQGRSTVSGWVSFKLSSFILNKSINKYEIAGITSELDRIVATSYILMDTFYEQNRKE